MSPVSNPRRSEEFSPQFRLHYPWEYRRFFSGAEVFRASECAVFRIPNSFGHYRLGITVKARVNSVERNRVKRRVREAFRRLGPELGAFDYNVVVPGTKRADYRYARKLSECLMGELPGLLSKGGQQARPGTRDTKVKR